MLNNPSFMAAILDVEAHEILNYSALTHNYKLKNMSALQATFRETASTHNPLQGVGGAGI